MVCYHPIVAYRAASVNESGRRSFVFDVKKSLSGQSHRLPCGQCIGCRLEYSRQWAIRCDHEARLYGHNAFVTLTYDDDHIPHNGTLVREHLQKFLKRLRFDFSAKRMGRVRYFGCGEYGEETARPHYHLVLFNCRFPDSRHFSCRNGYDVYHSEYLNKVWGLGRTEIGSVTFESAAYVARYCVGKVKGDGADAHYRGRLPEFSCMSLKPGVGYEFYRKYKTDIYPNDFVVINSRRMRPPLYYDDLLERDDPALWERVIAARKPHSVDDHERQYHDKQVHRLRVREEVAAGRMLKRGGQ